MAEERDEQLFEEESALLQAMRSEESDQEGTFLTGGGVRDLTLELSEEEPLDPELILNPRPVRDGPALLDFLRKNLHKFDSPYAYLGGEANSPIRARFHTAEVRVLIARLSTYESTSLSMAHSLLAQIAQELPNVFVDLCFLPKPNDYQLLKENGFPVWFGTNTKLAPDKFDLVAISNPISMEQVNYIPLLHDSGLPLFKDQRMERPDLPLIMMGGMNSATSAPLCGSWTDPAGNEHAHLIDGVVIGDGEVTLKQLIQTIALSKKTGRTKRQTLKAMHGVIHGFYEPDCYVHEYDGHSRITSIRHAEGREYAELPVRGAVVAKLDFVRTLETKILPFSGDGCSVDVAIAGCFAAGSLISTEHGRQPIETIEPGTRVISKSGALRTVKKRWEHGIQPLFRVTTQWGHELEVTANHVFPTVGKDGSTTDQPLSALGVGSKLMLRPGYNAAADQAILFNAQEERDEVEQRLANVWIPGHLNLRSHPRQRKDISLPGTMSAELAQFLGYLEGDGSKDADGVTAFYAWHERDLESWLRGQFKFHFDLSPSENSAGPDSVRGLRVSSRTLVFYLRVLSYKQRVPEQVRNGPIRTKAAYLRGLFDADGGIHPDRGDLACQTNNEQLMRDVQILLTDLGIFCSRRKYTGTKRKKFPGGVYDTKDSWRVTIHGRSSWERFAELVGFRLKQKANDLAYWLERKRKNATAYKHASPIFGDHAADAIKKIELIGEGKTYDLWIEGPEPYYLVGSTLVHNSRGCIGGPGGDCSFCREGNEAPYRERSLPKVLEALEKATVNQGTKEVSFFSLNFNQYGDLFPLVLESVKKGYQVGLISQRIDMLAETPEQVRVQRWLSKSNFTLGIEGVSERLRSFLAKNTTEEQILTTIQIMMEEGAGELKLFYIVCGIEDEADAKEHIAFMDKVEAMKKAGNFTTRFRISFTPLFPSANTPLQFYPAFAASNHGSRSLDPIFQHARELGWGRRLSVSGEEPLVSNTINHGGRNIFPLLLASHFQDHFRFYGNIPKGTWARWQKRIDQDPNIDVNVLWGQKGPDYLFPWDDVRMGMPKETLYEEFLKCVAFKGSGGYCLTTRLKKGKCLWTRCGLCSLGTDDRKPNQEVVQAIINRKVAPVIPTRVIEAAAKSREKAYHLRVRFRTTDPIYRFVDKNYWLNAIPRAMMKASTRFNDAFIKALGHARIAAGANTARDWTFGENIYDFSLSDHIPESELRRMIPTANDHLEQGEILDLRMDQHLTVLRNDIDHAIYSILIPNAGIAYGRLRNDIERYFERRYLGREAKIRIKKASGKGVFVTVEKLLEGEDVRQLTYQWTPEHRGTLVRMVISANYNPLAMLEALTQRKSHLFKAFPVYCHGYVQLSEETGETDLFAALLGEAQRCRKTGLPLERDLFTGEKMKSGVCLAAEDGLEVNFPVDMAWFHTKQMQAVELLAAE